MFDDGPAIYAAGLVARSSSAAIALATHGGGLVSREGFVAQTVRNIIFVKYYAIASVSILYFDYLVTLPDEIRRIWFSRFTGATVLFLLNRYVPIIGYIPILLSMVAPPWDIVGCRNFAPFIGALSTFSQAVIVVILVLRTYALYSRARWVLLLTAFFGIASIVIPAWSASAVEGDLFNFNPITTCLPMLRKNQRLKFAWITIFLFDFLVFVLTLMRTYRLIKAHAGLQMKSSLAMLVVRDGSFYFFIMSLVNAANFILYTELDNQFFAESNGANSVLSHIISVSLMSRLLLNLREESARHQVHAAGGGSRSYTAHTLTDTNLIFSTRLMGNLTAEIDYDDGENYYTYGGTTDDDEDYRGLRSAQSAHSIRSGSTAGTSRSTGTGTGTALESDGVEIELGSMAGTGTIAGSSSGSGSGSGSRKGKGRAIRGVGRPSSRGGWSAYTSTGSSSLGGTWDEEMHIESPTSAVEDPRVGLFTNRRLDIDPLERRRPASSPRSPASASTSAQASSPTLLQLSPSSTFGVGSPKWDSGGVAGDSGGEERNLEENDNEQGRGHQQQLLVTVGEAFEMTRMDRRRHGRGNGDEHDLHHDHYRQAPYTP